MKSFKLAVLTLVAVLSCGIANAAILSTEITGTVKSFDEKNVVLQQANETMTVPKKYFKAKQFKSGEQVRLKLNKAEFEALMAEQTKK